MSSPTLSVEQQRDLLGNLTSFLSLYKHISDSYIIEFFSEDLWETLPVRWQQALGDLSPPQIADLLLDRRNTNRSYPSVWPLSLFAFRATAHALAFPRMPQEKGMREVDTLKPEEFQGNQSQSSLLGHIFRKHVKPKKQHEIRRLGMLVKHLCDLTGCRKVVDVGSGQVGYCSNGQGHLTRFLSFGLGLSVTGIEADPALVAMASKFDGQLMWTLEKEKQKKNVSPQLCLSGPLPRHVTGWVNPKASWEVFIEQLGASTGVSGGQEAAAGPCKKRQRESASGGEQDRSLGERSATSSAESQRLGRSSDAARQRASLEEDGGDRARSPAGSRSEPESEPDESASPSSPKRLCKMDAGEGPCSGGCPCACRPEDEGEGGGRRGRPDVVLTGLHACGDLSATLLRHFATCPLVRGITSVACCYMKITTREHPAPPGLVAPPPRAPAEGAATCLSQFGYPMSSWVQGLPGHQLSYKAREGACHAVEDYAQRLREESALLRTHCYRAALETVIRGARPELRRAGIQTIKKAHLLSFNEYARLGLPRVGLPADLALDAGAVAAMLGQQGRVVVYFSLALMLSPVVETLVLLDRMTYLQERGIESQLVPLFDPAFSPRNLVLVALKPKRDSERNEGTRTSN